MDAPRANPTPMRGFWRAFPDKSCSLAAGPARPGAPRAARRPRLWPFVSTAATVGRLCYIFRARLQRATGIVVDGPARPVRREAPDRKEAVMFSDFRKFLLQTNALALAVGVIIGAAV